jgi:RHS repeat-associated protein
MGNRTKEEVFDPANALRRTQAQVFNTLGRLSQIKNAANQVVTAYGYDNQGNRTQQTDAGTYVTTNAYDPLNRVKQVTDAATGVTQYGYNALDQQVSVRDTKTLTTTYTFNALGDLKQQVSPDTGTTTYTYDSAGNRKTQSDARGITATYSYDALNRLTSIDYPGTSEDVSYSYDSTAAPNGVGRLTGIADASGTTTLVYDAHGNVTQETRFIASGTYVTSYTYDTADRPSSITYPSGRLVTYQRDAAGRVSSVTTTFNGQTRTVANAIQYMPFGGIKSYTLGNGVAVTRTYDLNYRLSDLEDDGTSTIQDLALSYDLRSNITALTDAVQTGRSQTFGYDALARLTSAAGAYGQLAYTYDGVGNRLSETATPPGGSATTSTYTYPSDSHRLSSISDGTSFSYDAMGNVKARGGLTLTYNSAARLAEASEGTDSVAALYNAAGQRVTKVSEGVTTIFHYDREGHLLAETTDGLLVSRDYIWLEGRPIAQVADRTIADLIVDNTSSGFTTAGAWSTATAGTGYYGSDYAKRGPAVELPGEKVLDDLDSGTSFTGVWAPSIDCGDLCPQELHSFVSAEPPYGSTFFHSVIDPDPASGDPATFTWRIPLAGAGRYRVYVRWIVLSGSGPVTYAITHAGGTSSHPIDQSVSSSGWYSLGSHDFSTEAVIALTPAPGYAAVADAVKVAPVEDTDSDIARWAASVEDGTYDVYARWPSVVGAASQAPFAVQHTAGTTSITQDQTSATGQWNLFGTYSFDDALTQGLRLTAVPDDTVLADAVHFLPVANLSHRYHPAYIHTDHLGTPQKMTDENQNIVWDSAYEPFGEAEITAQPHFESPLRFPGQYFDAETGLHQNHNRDYDKDIGRYLQSDPIGLKGGINTYLYANGNPIRFIDELGLAYFGKRPLKGLPWLGPLSSNPLDDYYNTEISHEQLFFEDGKSPSNLGFFDDGTVKEEPSPVGYRARSGKYNDCIMRKAVEKVPQRSYCLLGKPGSAEKFNCQDWAEAVRRIYNSIQNDPEVKQECGCEK